ncbi:MAG: Gfo/Idh/MocA family oxidoreductase [Candidatus Bathyarchaeota archaeon]|nr:Gfo/Idh/MocA family oxidoreductase [Candidatus Bathyarchaeota archaeon]
MDKLRVGIVGCGEIAVNSAKALSKARYAEIAIAMDIEERVAKSLAEEYGVPYTTSLDEVLSNREVGAVYVATPHHLHAPIAIQAAKMSKHVIVEKPIATNLEDANAMIRECKKNKVALSVAFQSRYAAGVIKARQLVEEGVIGKVIATEIRMLTRKPESYWEGGFTQRAKTDWRKSKKTSGGGVLTTNCVHDIDRVRYITGLEAVRVFSEYGTFGSPPEIDVEDTIAVLIRYAEGGIGWIEAGSAMQGAKKLEESRFDAIYGTDGQIILSRELRVYTTKRLADFPTNEWMKILLKRTYNPRARLFDEFAQAALAKRTPPITGEDGSRALEVIVAAYKSGELGKPVKLPMNI